MLDRASHIVAAPCGVDMPRLQDDATDQLLRAPLAGRDLSSDRSRVSLELRPKLALVIERGDDDVSTLTPLGIETVVMDDPSPDRVILDVDSRHVVLLSSATDADHGVVAAGYGVGIGWVVTVTEANGNPV